MKKTSTILLLIGAFLMAFMPVKAGILNVAIWGNDLSGDGSPGNPYATIQTALGSAGIGDTVMVEDGNYTGPINIIDDVTLMSMYGAQNCWIDGNADVTGAIVIDSANVVISGFSVYNAYNLVVVNGSNSAIIERCMFEGSDPATTKGIIFNGFSGMIHHNIFIDILDWAIQVTNGDPELSNNTIFQASTGIDLAMGTASYVRNNLITNTNFAINLDSANFFGFISYNNFWENGTNFSDPVYIADPSNLYNDPMYVDTSSRNLGLQPGSPCIDAGDPAIYDPDMTISDIGAIPYISGGGGFNVSFYVNPSVGCSGDLFSFTNMSDSMGYQGVVQYNWYLNDFYYEGFEIPDTILPGGNYYISLEALDSVGSFLGYYSDNFFVGGSAGYFRNSSGDQACPGQRINFWYEGQMDGTTFTWEMGDGSIFNYMSGLEHQYDVPGVYDVMLIVNDMCGIDSIIQPIDITNSAVPIINAYTERGGEFCPYDEIIFKIDGDYPVVEWHFDDGTVLNGKKVIYAFPDIGTKRVEVIATNMCGGEGRDTLFIDVRNDVMIYSGFDWWSNEGHCPFNPIEFNAHSSGSYKWDFGDGVTSTNPYPLHAYADTGVYDVTLITFNNCGFSDTTTQQVFIDYNNGFFMTDFEIFRVGENEYNNNNNGEDLVICTNETITMKVWDDGFNQDINYLWYFGDGMTSAIKNPSHSYSTGGMKTITLVATNNCNDSAIVQKQVNVDPSLIPMTEMMHIPATVCPGDEVFFFDDANDGDRDRPQYTYSIDFGDGTPEVTGIQDYEDMKIHTIASHVYSAGTYNYTFVAENECGNTDTARNTVIAQNDTSILPFYYVTNTTQSHDGPQGETEDWSINPGGSNVHQFDIPLVWTAWTPGLENTFFVYFWYGDFDPESDPGPPSGMISFVSNTMDIGDTITAYIPVRIDQFHSVGIAFAWYCNAAYAGDEPELFNMPTDAMLNPIKSFPLIPGDYTDVGSVSSGPIPLDPDWSGICTSLWPNGHYKAPTGTGNAYKLRMGEDQGIYRYELAIGPEMSGFDDGANNYLQYGSYTISADSIFIAADPQFTSCPNPAIYTFTNMVDSVIFYLVSDDCSERINALTSNTFVKFDENMDQGGWSGCPNDPIEFTVVGGNSYEWFFGDGSTLQTSEKYITHAYTDTGYYDAYVAITNSCGRVDTLHSPVNITLDNLPYPYFDMFPWEPMVGEPVEFIYHGWDPTNSYDYSWNFGDGSPIQNIPNPQHTYQIGGELTVRLMIRNGCGMRSEERPIFVRGGLNNCNIEGRFNYNIQGDSVFFTNNSIGDYNKVSWDFGDGEFSNEPNPMHEYAGPGIYKACLSIIDTVSQCQNYICMDIIIGNVECYADYTFTTVDATNTLKLTDQSIGAISWFWDFGDGISSNLKDPVHVYNQPGVYPVILQITNGTQSCTAEKQLEIEVGEIDSTYCIPEFGFFVDSMTITLSDQSSENITNWYWDFDDGTTSTKRSATHTYTKPDIYEICLSVEDTISGCISHVCKTVKVGIVDCQSKFSYFVDPATLTVTFTDKSLGSVSEWLWSFGDGNFSVLQNPRYKFAEPGIYDICLTVQNDSLDCVSTSCQRITVGQVQDCFADYAFIVEDMTVKFSDKSLGSVTDRYWNFGNGTFGFKANPIVTYKKAGVKTVCYFVSDTISGCQSEVCKEIKVGTVDCGAEFTYFIDQTTKQVDLYDKSIGDINKWLWDFGNGIVSFDTNATITYANYGVYDVCLTVSKDVTGGCASKLCKEIIVKDTTTELCNTKFTHLVAEGTRNVTFKDATLTDVTSWFWDFGDGGFSKDTSVNHTYDNDGTYEVCLSTYNAATGCYSEKCKPVSINTVSDTIEILDADFTYIPSSVGDSVKFIDESTGNPTHWYWTFGDGSYVKGVQKITHGYDKAGTFMACLNIFDSSTGNSSEECKMVTVGEATCNISASFGKFIDPDTHTVKFSNTSTGTADKWFWSFGDGTTSTSKSPEHQYASAGLYLVSLSARDQSGNCADYTADFIQVGSINCRADFTYTVDADSNKVTLKSKSKGDVAKYFWSFDDGTYGRGSTISHKFKNAGMYKLALTISTTGGACTDYKIEPVQIGTVECDADFSVYVDSASNTAYFTNEALGNSTRLLWQFGDGRSSIAENPVHTYLAPGYFTAALNVYDPVLNCMDHTEELILIGEKGIDCEADFYYQSEDNTVDFYDKSIGDDLTYFWWFGDGTSDLTENPSKTYTDGGYYNVCLTVYTPSGIQNTSCKFIPVNPPERKDCLAKFIYTIDTTTNTVTFTDQSIGNINKWIWKFGDASEVSNDQNPSHTYSNAGYKKVRLVSGDTITGCKSVSWEMINIGMYSQGLKAGFGYEIDSLQLKTGGYPVDFVGVSAGKPAKYVWNFGDGSTDSTSTSPTHEYASTGEYQVCLTVEDQVTEESDQSCETISVTGDIIESVEEFVEVPKVDLSTYPNPFENYTNINFSIPQKTKVNITVFDESGRLVITLINTDKEAGDHTITWDAIDEANGIYYIQLSTALGDKKTKMVVKKR